MADFFVRVKVDASGAVVGVQQVRGQLNQLNRSGKQVNATAKSMLTTLKRIAFATGLAFGAREVLRAVDSYTQMHNRLRTVIGSADGVTQAFSRISQIARETRSGIEETTELFVRMSLAARNLSVTQAELLEITKSVNQAVILSGANTNEARAGLIQFSQGMAAGALRGDELRSVLEQLPVVADVLAEELNTTRGALRNLAKDGAITSDVIVRAFRSAREELETRFQKTIPTVAQSFVVLQGQVTRSLGSLDTFIGTSRTLSRVMLLTADNIEIIISVMLALVPAILSIIASTGLATGAVTALAGAFKALTVAMLANPFTIWATAAILVISLLVQFRDQIFLTSDETTTLGTVFRATGALIFKAFELIGEGANAVVEDIRFMGALINQVWMVVREGARAFLQDLRNIGVWLANNIPGLAAVIRLLGEAWEFVAKVFAVASEELGEGLNRRVDEVGELIDEFLELGRASERAALQATGGVRDFSNAVSDSLEGIKGRADRAERDIADPISRGAKAGSDALVGMGNAGVNSMNSIANAARLAGSALDSTGASARNAIPEESGLGPRRSRGKQYTFAKLTPEAQARQDGGIIGHSAFLIRQEQIRLGLKPTGRGDIQEQLAAQRKQVNSRPTTPAPKASLSVSDRFTDINQNVFAGAFAQGGSFDVPGSGGGDRTLVSLLAKKGETVTVDPVDRDANTREKTEEEQKQQRPIVVQFMLGPESNIDSFRRSRLQISRDMRRVLGV